MNNKSNILIAMMLFSSLFLSAQSENGLTIVYNLFSDQITYYKDGQVVTQPKVNRNENILVKVTEFNPYITKAIVQVDQINYDQSSAGLTDGGFAMGGGSGFSGLGNMLGGLSMGADTYDEYGNIAGSRGASSEDILEAKNTFSMLTSQLKQVEGRLNKSYEKLQLFQNAENSKQLALQDIDQLKYNAHIKPSRIREMMEEEIRHAFAKQEGETIGINDLIDESKKKNDIKKTIDKYKSAQQDYESLTNKWANYSASLKLMNEAMQDDQLTFIHKSTDSIVGNMEKNLKNISSEQLEKEMESYNESQNQVAMAELRQVYEELQNNKFTYSFPPIQADGDEVVLDISFLRKNAIDEFDSYKSLTQKIPVSGGWKISGGLGLCFGAFTDETFKYSVVNDKIVSDENDAFIPVVASFAHFYRQTTRGLNVGGSFGIGLPILGGSSVQSASFFLGPTIILGQKQRLLLTGGVMGAKVERLSGGFEVGDDFESYSDLLPTTKKYELGYFIGISYNIL